MIDIDKVGAALLQLRWTMSLEHHGYARTMSGHWAMGTWIATASKDGDHLQAEEGTPSAALRSLVVKVSRLDPSIITLLGASV